jgi:hypothetical protein
MPVAAHASVRRWREAAVRVAPVAATVTLLGVLACHGHAAARDDTIHAIHVAVPRTVAFGSRDLDTLRGDPAAAWTPRSNLDLEDPATALTPAVRGVLDLTANTLTWFDAAGIPTAAPELATVDSLVRAHAIATIGSLARRYVGSTGTLRRALGQEPTRVFGTTSESLAMETLLRVRGAIGDPAEISAAAAGAKEEGDDRWGVRDPAFSVPHDSLTNRNPAASEAVQPPRPPTLRPSRAGGGRRGRS